MRKANGIKSSRFGHMKYEMLFRDAGTMLSRKLDTQVELSAEIGEVEVGISTDTCV